MFAAIVATGTALAREAGVRVVVLSGNGPSFCAGLDFSVMRAMRAGPAEAQAVMQTLLRRDDGPDNLAQRTAYVWKTLPMPVIAALHGVAFGGGCQIALAADLRIATPATRLSVMEIKYGLIPDMALTQTLPDRVAIDVAKELTLQRARGRGRRGPATRSDHPHRRPCFGGGARTGTYHRDPISARNARRQGSAQSKLARRRAARARAGRGTATDLAGHAQSDRSGQCAQRAARAGFCGSNSRVLKRRPSGGRRRRQLDAEQAAVVSPKTDDRRLGGEVRRVLNAAAAHGNVRGLVLILAYRALHDFDRLAVLH